MRSMEEPAVTYTSRLRAGQTSTTSAKPGTPRSAGTRLALTTQRLTAILAIALLPGLASACAPTQGLDGALTIPQCDAASPAEDCTAGSQALFLALNAFEIPQVFTIGVQSSPWRMYDGEGRILTVDDVAAAVRAGRPESDRRVRLVGSWTSARPDGSTDTLARRLSAALDGLPVDGSDGFLWLSQDGSAIRSTRQSASIRTSGQYLVPAGEDVMMALVHGVLIDDEDQLAKQGNADGVLHAGIGHDVFLLCPERAMAAFKQAAELGSAIGAYNAGLMHADAGEQGDAEVWLKRAVALGEPKAAAALDRLGGRR